MRTIHTIVIHTSATKPSMDIGVSQIRKWHTDPKPKGRGWKDIGYHYVIRRDGTLEDGRPNQEVGAHVKGHNKNSLGICLVGGVDSYGVYTPNYTKEQMKTLRALVRFLQKMYTILDKRVLGHRDFPNVKKACPCFDVQTWLKTNKIEP